LVAASHEPIVIAGRRGNAVLVSEDDWRGVQETLHLLSVPGMDASIREGLATPAAASPSARCCIAPGFFGTEGLYYKVQNFYGSGPGEAPTRRCRVAIQLVFALGDRPLPELG
jgi:hypothetical protein